MSNPPRPRVPQPWPVRTAHWLNAVLLAMMAGSGLQILVAYPYQGPRGAPYGWFPLQGWIAPEWARIGGWLAGARHWHFAAASFFIVNGLLYLAYLAASGEWRRRVFQPRRDARDAVVTASSYVRLRNPAPTGQLYNGLQRLAYTGTIAIGALEVLSGLVLYKPVQLAWLASLLGGYDSARLIHFGGLALLAAFTVGHVVMVALHPRSLREMITGGRGRE